MEGDDDHHENPNSLSVLPPGCHFFPSEEQLLCIYLTQKHSPDGRSSLIKEIDLYDYEPFNLPDSICFRFGKGGRKRHYYCYVGARGDGERPRRAGSSGFWKRSGKMVRDVVVGTGKAVVGTRKTFVFYLGDFVSGAKGACRTDWFMHQYHLLDPNLASFVICRIFVKTRRCNRSERPLSSCAEESVATVRNVGVQHDGTVKLVTIESNMLGRSSPDQKNKVLRFPMGMVRGLHNEVIGGPVDMQMTSFGHTSARDMMIDPLNAQQLTAILENNFLELDDLVSPLWGID